MKTMLALLLSALVLPLVAQAQEKEKERLKHAGEVLIEILNIPDNLPKGILDRAECVIVLPSVKKGAIGIGASIGGGAAPGPRPAHRGLSDGRPRPGPGGAAP